MIFPTTPPITKTTRKIHPDSEKFAIGVYKAPTLHPLESLVPNPIAKPPIA